MNDTIQISLAWAPVVRSLREVAVHVQDRRALMAEIAGIMLSATEDNFEEQGRPRWAALHPATIAARTAQGTWPGRILQRSGQLAASITPHSDNDSAVVGTNKVYAAIHQFGGRTKAHVIEPRKGRALAFGGIVVRRVRHPGSQIPARPFLYLTPTDQREIYLAGQQFLARALARSVGDRIADALPF